jgi:hypothetical protein
MAKVLDVSQKGLYLLFDRRPALAMLLTVELEETPRVFSRALVARVRVVRRHSPTGWAAGCEFLQPLTEAEFEAVKAHERRVTIHPSAP